MDVCGTNGITLNPDKFHFAELMVEFAGFVITMNSVQPSDKHLEAICDFPTPTNITDVRSWLGLVNQVAYVFAAREVMALFRPQGVT